MFLDEGRELGALVDRLDLGAPRGSEAVPLGTPAGRGDAHVRNGAERESPAAVGQQLTKREASILKRLESGLSNKEIAEAIFISEGTLKWHLHNVYSKLDVKNRPGAMAKARTLGIL